MKKSEALKALQELDQRGIYVLTKGDLAKAFPGEQDKALEKSLQRLVADGILERVTKGVYLYPYAKSKRANTVEEIAAVLRRGCYSYVSLESRLSEYGVVSQVPISRISVMTSGARGVYATPYGTIEFTHTKRRPAEILKRSVSEPGRTLRLAKRDAAVQDLLRVGRNTSMIDQEALRDE
jgi:predicted transcriptional regulator of viral defense system